MRQLVYLSMCDVPIWQLYKDAILSVLYYLRHNKVLIKVIVGFASVLYALPFIGGFGIG